MTPGTRGHFALRAACALAQIYLAVALFAAALLAAVALAPFGAIALFLTGFWKLGGFDARQKT